jgi:hypothetical protein
VDVSKKDWDAWQEELGRLKGDVQMLKQSVESLDKFREKAEPNMWFVIHLRTILALSAFGLTIVILTTGLSYLERFHTLEADSKHYQQALNNVGPRVDELAKSLGNLRNQVTVLYDRQPRGPTNLTEVIVYQGKIVEVTPNAVTILPPDLGEAKQKFILGPEVVIRRNGVTAKIEDLAVGMMAEIVRSGGIVTSIDANAAGK